tara:strand:- start:271 stop:465 length:195 start_codon:yes stop_codon:yes gene_type:complete
MSRVVYENGKLFLSLTRAEVEEAYQNIGRPLEIDIGNLKVLHEDITQAMQQAWREMVEKKYGKK